MSDKPTIVLVHGFWGGAAHWNKVIAELIHKGITSIRAVEMPLTSLADDAERTRKMVAQVPGPVLLVGHSYGGAVITEAGDQPKPTWLPTAMAICGSNLSSITKASARTCPRPKGW